MRQRRDQTARALAVAGLVVVLAACGLPLGDEPGPAVIRASPPPWDAPRDAQAYMQAAGLAPQLLDYRPDSRASMTLTVQYAGEPVQVPARIGEDRPRALTTGLHTHEDTGKVWLEPPAGRESERGYTLGQFFTLWGVRLTDACLADRCGSLVVRVNGVRSTGSALGQLLAPGSVVDVSG